MFSTPTLPNRLPSVTNLLIVYFMREASSIRGSLPADDDDDEVQHPILYILVTNNEACPSEELRGPLSLTIGQTHSLR